MQMKARHGPRRVVSESEVLGSNGYLGIPWPNIGCVQQRRSSGEIIATECKFKGKAVIIKMPTRPAPDARRCGPSLLLCVGRSRLQHHLCVQLEKKQCAVDS
eukprot:5058697-Pleurochrysis_carterae.AAC.1